MKVVCAVLCLCVCVCVLSNRRFIPAQFLRMGEKRRADKFLSLWEKFEPCLKGAPDSQTDMCFCWNGHKFVHYFRKKALTLSSKQLSVFSNENFAKKTLWVSCFNHNLLFTLLFPVNCQMPRIWFGLFVSEQAKWNSACKVMNCEFNPEYTEHTFFFNR